jgi:hypothetical protein
MSFHINLKWNKTKEIIIKPLGFMIFRINFITYPYHFCKSIKNGIARMCIVKFLRDIICVLQRCPKDAKNVCLTMSQPIDYKIILYNCYSSYFMYVQINRILYSCSFITINLPNLLIKNIMHGKGSHNILLFNLFNKIRYWAYTTIYEMTTVVRTLDLSHDI